VQSPLPVDDSQKLINNKIKKFQEIVCSILYYAWVVDKMATMALGMIASEQTKETEKTMEKAYHVLNYLATYPDTKVGFQASNMVMNIHFDTLYLTEPNAHSRACSHFSWDPYLTRGNPSN
jgi:hypothetical protein